MPTYEKGPNWNGTSWNYNAGRSDPNHDSELDFTEVCRLIGTAVSIFPASPITGEGADALNAFKAALLSDDAEITVVKGVHERDFDPHIRASIEHDGETLNYHINLATGTRTFLSATGEQVRARDSRFVWKAVQVSVKVGGSVYKYPVADPSAGAGNRRRGYSFTQGQLVAHIAAAQAVIAEREAAAVAASVARIRQAELERRTRRAAGKNPWG